MPRLAFQHTHTHAHTHLGWRASSSGKPVVSLASPHLFDFSLPVAPTAEPCLFPKQGTTKPYIRFSTCIISEPQSPTNGSNRAKSRANHLRVSNVPFLELSRTEPADKHLNSGVVSRAEFLSSNTGILARFPLPHLCCHLPCVSKPQKQTSNSTSIALLVDPAKELQPWKLSPCPSKRSNHSGFSPLVCIRTAGLIHRRGEPKSSRSPLLPTTTDSSTPRRR
ncbi:hypothetical protein F5144DRAFT_377531 [Chaetomium tenue]|uniref:Uncharacterized protein n=1 Tax=Chaetomium tenue TaxID=1854479 RepID=A0ACB7NZB8_9PEZI|nr:hypothetical protein F5144DRAFT_377531 [Chaetomium globosum]